MKRYLKWLLPVFLVLPILCYAQSRQAKLTSLVELAFGSIPASYTEALSKRKYVALDPLNQSDCIILIRFDDLDGQPEYPVPPSSAGDPPINVVGSTANSAISWKYKSGETCSSGYVSIQGAYL